LLKYRSEFLKVQEDLNVAKERDKEQYYNIVERLRDMYRESGAVSFLPDLPYALI
jgi:WD and tetratricopeptide repeat-containing protein 1